MLLAHVAIGILRGRVVQDLDLTHAGFRRIALAWVADRQSAIGSRREAELDAGDKVGVLLAEIIDRGSFIRPGAGADGAVSGLVALNSPAQPVRSLPLKSDTKEGSGARRSGLRGIKLLGLRCWHDGGWRALRWGPGMSMYPTTHSPRTATTPRTGSADVRCGRLRGRGMRGSFGGSLSSVSGSGCTSGRRSITRSSSRRSGSNCRPTVLGRRAKIDASGPRSRPRGRRA